MPLTHNTDHEDQAADRHTEVFRGKLVITGLTRSWAAEVQELENAAIAVITADDIDNAVGWQLDSIGNLVGQGRGKLDDANYRVWLKARVAVNRSSGKASEILSIVTMLVPTGTAVRFIPQPPAAFEISIDDQIDGDLGNQIARVLKGAEAGGVRILTSWRPSATTFKYSSNFSADTGSSSYGYGAGEYSAISDGSADRPIA